VEPGPAAGRLPTVRLVQTVRRRRCLTRHTYARTQSADLICDDAGLASNGLNVRLAPFVLLSERMYHRRFLATDPRLLSTVSSKFQRDAWNNASNYEFMMEPMGLRVVSSQNCEGGGDRLLSDRSRTLSDYVL